MKAKVGLAVLLIVGFFLTHCGSGESYRIEVVILEPADGDTLKGVIEIRAAVSGNDPVLRIDFFAQDSLGNDTLLGYDTNPPFVFDWDTRSFDDGLYRLYAIAYGRHIEARSDEIEVFVANNLGVTPPESVYLTAAGDGELVQVCWTSVDSAEGYILYFMATNDAVWNTIYVAQGADDTCYIHDPHGRTGFYRVTSYRGTAESRTSQIVSTIPVETDTITICDVNYDNVENYYSGYGWSRSDGSGQAYSMLFPDNASSIDFYFTNFLDDCNTQPFYFASPAFARTTTDSLIVREGAWRNNGIKWVERQFAMTVLPDTGYSDSFQVVPDAFYAVKTQDGYYGLIEVRDLNQDSGFVSIRTWFQKVHGLRLFQR